jgi:hypothetical protein
MHGKRSVSDENPWRIERMRPLPSQYVAIRCLAAALALHLLRHSGRFPACPRPIRSDLRRPCRYGRFGVADRARQVRKRQRGQERARARAASGLGALLRRGEDPGTADRGRAAGRSAALSCRCSARMPQGKPPKLGKQRCCCSRGLRPVPERLQLVAARCASRCGTPERDMTVRTLLAGSARAGRSRQGHRRARGIHVPGTLPARARRRCSWHRRWFGGSITVQHAPGQRRNGAPRFPKWWRGRGRRRRARRWPGTGSPASCPMRCRRAPTFRKPRQPARRRSATTAWCWANSAPARAPGA